MADNNYLHINSGTSGHNPATNSGGRSTGPNNLPNPGQSGATIPIGENTQERENTPQARRFVQGRIPAVLAVKLIFDITVVEAEHAGPTTPVQIDD